MAKKVKFNTDSTNLVQLISDSELQSELGEAFSSILLSPAVSWAKFVLTDDKANSNGQRIPVSEFKNLISTGIYMPIKMTHGEIRDHDDAEPLGVIAHLKQEDNKIMALAALWNRERPADVQYIKDLVASGESVNISWEILYQDYNIDDGGVVDLVGTALRAATIVSNPAYMGRTPLVAVAAEKWSPAFISDLPEENFLYVDGETRLFPYKDESGNVDPTRFKVIKEDLAEASISKEKRSEILGKLNEIEESFKSASADTKNDNADSEENILDELKELQKDRDALAGKVESLETKLSETEATLKAKDEELKTLSEEVNGLREFKSSIEELERKAEKLAEIRERFVEAGIEKPDEYFSENEEKLLAMDEANLEFMIQEMVSFASKKANEDNNDDDEEASLKVPNLSGNLSVSDVDKIAHLLKERKAK